MTIKNFGLRLDDLLTRVPTQWSFSLEPTVNGPVSVEKTGWVLPDTYVSIEDSMSWANVDSKWKAPKQQVPGKRSKPKCQYIPNDEVKEVTCYLHRYSGFYWGKHHKVSNKLECEREKCVFSPEFSIPVALENSPRVNITTSVLTNFIPSFPPTPLKWNMTFDSAKSFKILQQGPAVGYIFFKPLFWATSGWYSHVAVRANTSYVQSFQIETRIPISFAKFADGAFSFVTV
ncbi:hypothetical protein DSO57_1016040 [Entomophthora muscae]|uniref:Uncharacterized protein n=1 Tax=Entomophthora muscae TaxID=34485 RepID=A0ACC2UDW9_9FUNG|nr:hypothetical protein DSO57_1016040 [Entomophthora muscae]